MMTDPRHYRHSRSPTLAPVLLATSRNRSTLTGFGSSRTVAGMSAGST